MQNQTSLLSAHNQKMQEISELLSVTAALGTHYFAYNINPTKGFGGCDMYDAKRMCLSRGNLCFNKPQHLHCEMPFSLGVTISLAGRYHFIHRNSGNKYHIDPPQILLRKGDFGPIDAYLPANTLINTVSLDFNTELLEQINHTVDNKVTRFFQDVNSSGILLLEKHDARLICLTQYLSGISHASNELDLINLEGQALSLLSSLFRLPPEQQGKYYEEIETVICILKSHYHEKTTIPKLARQVGMNECYLKRYFKKYTGQTINTFLEKYRMELALTLFSQGKMAHEVASEIGYDNFYYFKSIFRKHFGYFPEQSARY